MHLTKLAAPAAVALALGLWPATNRAAPRAPVPLPAPPRAGVIVLTSFQPAPPVEVVTPDGVPVDGPPLGAAPAPINFGERPVCPLWLPRLSPDGKRLAAVKLGPIPQDNKGPWTPNHVWLFDLGAETGPAAPLVADARCPVVVWSADGTKLYGSRVDPAKEADPRENGKPPPLTSWVYDLATKKVSPLALPLGHGVTDASSDGKTLLTVVEDPFDPGSTRSYLVPLDTLQPRLLTPTAFKGMRFSPDGKRVLGNRSGKKGDKLPPLPLATVAVADGSERPVSLPAGVSWVYHACWSPDGRRIAYLRREELPPAPGAAAPRHASRVTVADADGGNAKTIVKRSHDHDITGLDWR